MQSRYLHRVAAWLVPLSACSCLAGVGYPQTGDSSAGRCQQGLDLFERGRCQPGQGAQVRVEAVRYELDELKRQCTDDASRARIAQLEPSCLTSYRVAQAALTEDRRQIRARYVDQVSALLLDPDYPVAADRYKDLADGAPGDHPSLVAARELLFQLARKHGIDPSHGKELDLW